MAIIRMMLQSLALLLVVAIGVQPYPSGAPASALLCYYMTPSHNYHSSRANRFAPFRISAVRFGFKYQGRILYVIYLMAQIWIWRVQSLRVNFDGVAEYECSWRVKNI